jgi:hypothetical protein
MQNNAEYRTRLFHPLLKWKDLQTCSIKRTEQTTLLRLNSLLHAILIIVLSQKCMVHAQATITGVSTSVTSGATAMGGFVYGSSFYYEYPDGSKVYASSQTVGAPSGLRFFDKDGVLLCSASSMACCERLAYDAH